MHIKKIDTILPIIVVLLLFSGCTSSQSQITVTESPSKAFGASSTPLPSKTVSILATTIANATKKVQEHKLDCNGYPDNQNTISPDYSPNRSWRFTFCLDPNTGFTFTKFIQSNGPDTWNVPFYEAYGSTVRNDQFPDGIKSGKMLPIYWSKDGDYVYLRPYWCCIDGPGMFFVDALAIYRLNLNTGELEVILPSSGAIAFSPNGRYLAYSTEANKIYLRKLETGENIPIQLGTNYENIGVFSWSPDNKMLIFVAASGNWEDNIPAPSAGSKSGFSLLLLNLETMKITTLIDNDIHLLRPSQEETWISNEKIRLNDAKGNVYLYEIGEGRLLIQPTPTP